MKRSMKKFVSIILSMLMAVALLPANVMAAVEIEPSVADSYIINEDFADSVLDTNIGTLPDGAEVTADGVLKLTSGSVSFNVDSASNWNTLKCISMKLKKDNLADAVSVKNPNAVLNVYWHANNAIRTWKGGSNVFETITATTSDWVTLKMVMNPTLKEYLVLIEVGDKVYTFIESLSEYNAIGNGNAFKLEVVGTPAGNIYVDDLKVYNADETSVPAETAVLWDAAYLNSTLPKTADSSITLPSTGKYGSAINWSSSNTGVIANDGTVTRQAADTDVTLTATVQKAGKIQTQSYKVTVLKNYITPVSGGFGYEENFSNASPNSNITLPKPGAEITNDGVLKLTSGSVSFNVDSASTWNTLKCISMKLKKDNLADVVSIQNPNAYLHVYWHANNAIRTWKGGVNVFETITATTSDWVTLKMVMNPTLKEYLVLIEVGDKVYTFIESLSEYNAIGNGNTFKLNVGSGATGNIYVDDLKVYDVVEASVPAKTAFEWDKEILEDMIPEKVESNLPQMATYGSVIKWSANVEGIVASDGTVTRPDADTPVTLTATITNTDGTTKTATANAMVKKAVVVADGNYIINEDFATPSIGSWANEKITLTGATVADGKLKLSSTDNKASFKFADSTGWTELIGYKFDITKSDASQVVRFTTGGIAMQFYWHSNGALVINEGGTLNWGSGSLDATGTITVTGLINPVLDNYSLIIEDSKGTHFIKSWDNIPNFYVKNATTLDVIYQSGSGDITVDNVKLFKVVETSVPEETAVLWDAAILDSVIPENIEADLSTVGTYGSSISWSSAVSGIVTSDGIIALPTEDTAVTFTATFTNGDAASQTSTITRTVKTAEFKFGKLVYSGTGYDNGALKDGAVTVSFPVTKVNATVDGVVVISAAYKLDENGYAVMKDVDVCPVSFSTGNAQTATMNLTVENGCFIKTFVLDSLSTLVPQSSPFVLGQ